MTTKRFSEAAVTFSSLDGTALHGTAVVVDSQRTALFVHGGGMNRDEGGFFRRAARALAERGYGSFRFDYRGHGESGGRPEDVTLAGVLSDITAAFGLVEGQLPGVAIHVIGTSFSGGVCALFGLLNATRVASMVLINPLVDYRGRLLLQNGYCKGSALTPSATASLSSRGWLPHKGLCLGPGLINEVLHLDLLTWLSGLEVPTLVVHGSHDSQLPLAGSRRLAKVIRRSRMLQIEGADHDLTSPGRMSYSTPEAMRTQEQAIVAAIEWMNGASWRTRTH